MMIGISLALLAGFTGQAAAAESDLLAAALAGQSDERIEDGCYGLSEVMVPYDRGGALLILPKKDGKTFNKIVAPAIKVKPSTRYVIDWEVLPQQSLRLLVFTVYENPRNGRDPLNHVMSFENSSAFMRVEKEIITPPDATRLRLHIYLSAKSLKSDTLLGFFKSLKIREIGLSQPAPALQSLLGKNILPISNFDALEVGEKDLSKMGLFTGFAQKPYAAEIVRDEGGRKVLRVNYKPGDYQYISWYSPGIMNLYGSAGTMKCRMRGKGRVQLMVFWGRPKFHSIFRHFGFFDLTPEWKEYSVGIGCDDPLTERVSATIACRDNETEFEISDISYILAD